MTAFSPYTNDLTLLPKVGGAVTGAVTMTVDNTDNYIPLTINQNDTTNNPKGLSIVNAGTENGLFIDQNGNGYAISIDSESTTYNVFNANGKYGPKFTQDISGGYGLAIIRNINEAGGNALVLFQNDHVSNTQPCLSITEDGTGNGIFIDQNANGLALNIDKDCTVNDTRTWAAQIASDNAGTGTALGCGIDMSSFSVDEPILKVVADVITTAGTLSGQIAIDIAGTTYYLEYFTHGS